MTDQKATREVQYLIESLPFDHLLTVDLCDLGLQSRRNNRWIYRSRSFTLLGRSIQPHLHFSLHRTNKIIILSIDHVEINGFLDLEHWIKFTGNLRLTPKAEGVEVVQDLQIELCRQGIFAMAPIALVTRMLNAALAQTSTRMVKAIRRNLKAAIGAREMIHG